MLRLTLFLLPALISSTTAADWPHWRGPLGNGSAPDATPPIEWSATNNIQWKSEIPGEGSSTPIVLGDRIFVQTAVDTGKEAAAADIPKPNPKFPTRTRAPSTYHEFILLCLDRKTGKKLWSRVATRGVPHEGRHRTHTYAAFSPMTDGKFVYASFGSQGIFCFDLEGNQKWKKMLPKLHTRRGWGEGAPPLVHDNSVILTWDHEGDSALYVLDSRTGKEKWHVKRDEPTTWATPVVAEHQGTKQLIVSGTNRVRSYDLATGKVIWSCGGQSVNAIPTPIVHKGVVYCMTGYRGNYAVAIPLDAKGDITGTKKIIWEYKRGTPYVPSPVLYKDRLYFTQGNNGLLTSLDIRTGKATIDRARLPEIRSIYASPVAAQDRIYIVGRGGTTVVLKHGDKLKVIATNKLGEEVDASPVLVGKQLFLRGKKHLYCIEKK